ncbi:MAG: helix-turn-helix transcriptional regulator [Tissierella sp.]|nr:helix-turn-helix transcriptional regulator [Tissierella sp.]
MYNLKKIRLNQNKTQEQMAELLNIGVSTYNQYENSGRNIPFDTAKKIAEILAVDINDIFLPIKFTVSKNNNHTA